MASVFHLTSAANETYSSDAFSYIQDQAEIITNAANIIGISASAIAGAMVEENHAYGFTDEVLDLYARSGLTPTIAAVTLGAAIPLGTVGLTAWVTTNAALLYATRRTHEEWKADYEIVKNAEAPDALDKILHPALIDAGYANIKIATAIDMVIKYANEYPALGLGIYANDYARLVDDLMNRDSSLSAVIYGLYLKEEAEPFFTANGAYGGQWGSLPQEFRDALLITFSNRGLQNMEKTKRERFDEKGLPYEPQPGLTTSGGMNHLLNAQAIGAAISLASYGDGVGSVDGFANAARATDGEAYRYALYRMRYVALPGVDHSARNQNGELDLYNPATHSGSMTEQYIEERSNMLRAYMQEQMAGTVGASGQWGDTYLEDIASGWSITVDGWDLGTVDERRVIFGAGTADAITGNSRDDRLFGGAGNDALNGKGGNDYLEGGTGNDTYEFSSANGGDGQDQVLDTDGQGQIKIDGNVLGRFIEVSAGTSIWRSVADRNIVANKTSDGLLIRYGGNSSITVQDWQAGALGITLDANPNTEDFNTAPADATVNGTRDLYWGSTGADLISTGKLYDTVFSGGGNDLVYLGDDNDRGFGGVGNDTIYGEAGNDYLSGSQYPAGTPEQSANDADLLVGGSGNDLIHGGIGDDIIYTGEIGDERLAVSSAERGDWAQGGEDNDSIYGSTARDFLNGGAGADWIEGGGGDDVILGDGGYWSESPTTNITTYEEIITWYPWGPQITVISMPASDVSWNAGAARWDKVHPYSVPLTLGNTYRWEISASGEDFTLNSLVGLQYSNHYVAGGRGDWLFGGYGNDWMAGQVGDDVLYGGEGNDTLFGDDNRDASVTGNDRLHAGQGADLLYGGAGNDTLYAAEADGALDRLYGGDGDDHLWGGGGDELHGEAGNDVLLAGDAGNDTLWGDEGADTLFGGNGADILHGGEGNDLLAGGAGNDLLMGEAGDDLLEADEGNDTLQGGAGNDSYHLISGALRAGGIALIDDDDGTLYLDGQRLTGEGFDAIADNQWTNGTLTATLAGGTLTLKLAGSTGCVEIRGYTLDNYGLILPPFDDQENHAPEIGVALTDQEASEDTHWSWTLPAGAFTDVDEGDALTLSATLADGGMLPAWLSFDAATGVLTGTPDHAAVGTLALRITATDLAGASVSQVLALTIAAAPVEPVDPVLPTPTLIGTPGNDTLVGTGGNDVIDGRAGSDRMSGGLGDDIYFVDNPGDVVVELPNQGTDTVYSSITYTLPNNVENLTLIGTDAINATGNSANNVLTGNSAANVLDGKYGDDTMIGGAGDDTYIVDRVGDVVIEEEGGGTDTVLSAVSLTLSDHVENLTLTGTKTLNGTGNALANVLTGNSAANVLDGGAGADTLIGGAGSDTYVIDNLDDVVIENENEGIDTVRASVGYTLGANLENLILLGSAHLTGTGNELANTLTGNTGDNILDGGTGADTLIGGLGNDTYLIDNVGDVITETPGQGIDSVFSSVSYTLKDNLENLTLVGETNIDATGNGAGNVLTGNAGANVLDGKYGDDTMIGGAGDDTYIVDRVGDIISEEEGGGIDTVLSAASYTLSDHVENLTLTGTKALNGTGNAQANVLTGNAAANILDGGAGDDTLIGGLGKDTYLFGRGYGADTIIEDDATAGVTDLLKLGTDIAADQLWFRQVGMDLELSLIGTTDKMTIQDWYEGSAHHVEQFKTADGKTLLDSQVDNLVQAMAAFAPPAAGQTTLPPDYHSALNVVIAASWK